MKQTDNILLAMFSPNTLLSLTPSFSLCYCCWSISHVLFRVTVSAADGRSLSPTLFWRAASWLAAPANAKRSVRRGLQLEVKEKSSIPLISYLLFFPPFFTILHCASPASTEKGNLEEIASAFCSKVQPFLLHLLGCSRRLNKSIS